MKEGEPHVDPFAIALRVGRALDEMGVVFHIGGSLASSVHGFPRATLDADLVAALQVGQGIRLAAGLADSFYADERAMEAAIACSASFNVIHLATMFKVDVFVRKDTPFDRESFDRSREERIGEPPSTVRVATPEDTILHKLIWYEKGGRGSSRQWDDLLGVLEVQAERLDREYLVSWAARLNVLGLLERALAEAGGREAGPA